ncbi:hypothetical protein GGI07_002333 [Coemansia sp. Benny D115]|nr:hypothetical protein GGI07_002333 [Coemansia sp. Benny D115]
MRLQIPATILFTATAVAATEPRIHVRQGLLENIQNGLNDAANNFQDLFNIGHAGEDSDSNSAPATANQDTTPSAQSEEQVQSSTSRASSTRSTSGASSTAASTSSSPTSKEDSHNTDETTKDEEEKTTEEEQEDPKPTGAACSNDGEKRCKGSQSSAYELCQDGTWIEQKCGGSDICGNDSLGAVACIDKDATVVKLESCSKKNEQRCSSSDPGTYQTCDGKHWQNFGCGSGTTCFMSGKKAQCGGDQNNSGGDNPLTISYSLISQKPFVPESAASAKCVLGSAAVVIALAGLF